MGFPDEMQRLADDVRAAHDDRVAAMAGLRGAVSALRASAGHAVTRLHADHRKMALALGEWLSDANDARHYLEQKRQTDEARAARDRTAYVAAARATVASLRASTASRVKGINDLRRQAHRAWTGLGATAASPAPPRGRRGTRG